MSREADDHRLDALESALARARTIAHELRDDELLTRLLDVFARMPEADRATIVAAIEREVETRVLSQDVADTLTRIQLRPNPNARLYLRVIEQEPGPDDVEMMAFLRAAYSVQRNVDSLDPTWRAMVVMALQQMDPVARNQIDEFNRAMRMLLDEAARGNGTQAETAGVAVVIETPAEPETVARPRK